MTEQRVVCAVGVHDVMKITQTFFSEGWLVHTMVQSTTPPQPQIIIVFQREKPSK